MGFFSRILGISKTKPPENPESWRYQDGRIRIDLDRTPELSAQGGAIRLEGGDLPCRVLVVHGRDGQYHAFLNKCTHMGRRLDPLPGQPHIQCCSVSKTTYEYDGRVISGAGKSDASTFSVEQQGNELLIPLGRSEGAGPAG